MPVVCAEELHAKTRHKRLMPGVCDSPELLGDMTGDIEGTVRDMETRWFGPDLLCDRVQELLLRERPVVGDVVCLTRRAIMIERKKESLHHIGYINEGQGVTARPDDEAFAGLQPIRHST